MAGERGIVWGGLECQDVKMSKCQNEKWGWLLERKGYIVYIIYI